MIPAGYNVAEVFPSRVKLSTLCISVSRTFESSKPVLSTSKAETGAGSEEAEDYVEKRESIHSRRWVLCYGYGRTM